ncbi:hypothetical protein M404DRAFT_20906 [Pisolithus tinctorius Marx 270]|uniref:Nephrocystin 3-like N-terminal domain-containing protein n=1 Tax=Pisolithus tinctorius Marx 270 TaxID=870435 RepID=A0A0C3JN78_PISTI|nr:hypothetical protein M404DRAFT_20906 [Pisolithus tinctorius Marx 270]
MDLEVPRFLETSSEGSSDASSRYAIIADENHRTRFKVILHVHVKKPSGKQLDDHGIGGHANLVSKDGIAMIPWKVVNAKTITSVIAIQLTSTYLIRTTDSSMARLQPKKRRVPYIGKSSLSAPNVPPVSNLFLPAHQANGSVKHKSQGQSEAPVGGTTSNPAHSGHCFKGKLATMKSLFIRSRRGPSSSSANPIVSEGAQQEPEPQQVAQDVDVDTRELHGKAGPDPDPVSVGDDLDVAGQLLESIKPIPRAGEIAVNVVAQTSTAVADIENLSSNYLQPLKIFNSVVTTIANIHPYAQIALGILTAASQLIIAQANLDSAISELLKKVGSVYAFLSDDDTIKNIDTMRVPLANIARVIGACAQFIRDYLETTNFWRRLGKNIMSETQTAIDDYTKTLDGLMQQYRDCQTRDIQINIYRVLEDLNMEGMAYAGGAGLNTMKKCLENTRTEILQDIINWVNDTHPDARRILWLHGQAGRGKSAIAHTIASWLKDVGGLGSCFCFARDRQTERRVLAEDPSLKTTPDLLQQWQKLILEPLSKAAGSIVGNVVVVIDALDESGGISARENVLLLLTTEAASLPSNFRILLTSRPSPDIECALSDATRVRAMCLDDVPAELAQRDITLFVSKKLVSLKDTIGPTEIQQIVQKSNGLFEWARLACEFVDPKRAFGQTVEERFMSLIAIASDEGKKLLDGMYATILGSVVPKSGTPFLRFRSVMQQVLTMLEPLPMAALNHMRSVFPNKEDHYDVVIILQFMAPVLGGVADGSSPVRPLHASFYDFLTDHSRSGDYFIDTSNSSNLAYASMRVLTKELRFNICRLENSYLSNSQIPDLPERIKSNISQHLSYSCKFWAEHLGMAKFDSCLATSVQAIVESEKILFWIEALSLLGALGSAESSLAITARWLQIVKYQQH